jgi:hypothetical protein
MEMSETRDELEHRLKTQELTAPKAEVNNLSETSEIQNAAADNSAEAAETGEVICVAPPGYGDKFASEFGNLPTEWQIFLCEREAENEKTINDYCKRLEAYGFLEFLFGNARERFNRRGFKTIQEWLQALAWLDAAMEENPEATLRAVALVYGVDLKAKSANNSAVSPEMVARVCKLERGYHDLTSYLQQEQNRNLANLLFMFGRQTDQEGNLLHPYFEAVKELVSGLLESGLCADIETAYGSALWLCPSVRDELIQKQISSKAAEADKAKKAAFAVKGKADMPARELTLRETLEKNMAALMG